MCTQTVRNTIIIITTIIIIIIIFDIIIVHMFLICSIHMHKSCSSRILSDIPGIVCRHAVFVDHIRGSILGHSFQMF
jgi:hypothetical protein